MDKPLEIRETLEVPAKNATQVKVKKADGTSRAFLSTLLTLFLIIAATTVLYLYTSGYRLTRDRRHLEISVAETGMVSAKSIPDGASVYLNGALLTATDDTISGITPGIHTLKIVKKGYVDWSKDIEVFPQLVTDITAVLVPQSPRLEPLTNTGAQAPSISYSLNKLAYFSKEGLSAGVWVMPLSQGAGLSLFRTTAQVVLKDIPAKVYSDGKSIQWSPDEKQLLIEDNLGVFYLYDIENEKIERIDDVATVYKEWATKQLSKRMDFIEKLDIPNEIRALAVSEGVLWSPDDKKFLYQVETGENVEYRVYNMEKPIPVGEKAENTVFTLKKTDPKPKISWYADSFHLILVENFDATQHRGTISLIRIDGTNKTEIYNNTMYSDNVVSTPGGDKVIILTSFKSTGNTDLYTIGVR